MAEAIFAVQNQDAVRQVQVPLAMPGGPLQITLDPRQASLVYPFSQGWLALQQHIQQTTAGSINGVSSTFDIEAQTGATSAALIGGAPQLTSWRIYDHIKIELAGGTVTPLIITCSYYQAPATLTIITYSAANPGYHLIRGPILVPPTVSLRLSAGIGGAGDTVRYTYTCRSAAEGVEIPPI